MTPIQSKVNQIVSEAATRILDSWGEWEAEGEQIAQCEQDSDAYDDFMRRQLEAVIRLCVNNVQRIIEEWQRTS